MIEPNVFYPAEYYLRHSGSDKILTVNDAELVTEELIQVQEQALELGRACGLPERRVLAIEHRMYGRPRGGLYEVILEVLRSIPRPTWRLFINGTKSIGHHSLAQRLERAHYPDSTSAHNPALFSTTSVELDKKLTQNDAANIFEKLLPVRRESYRLGLKLGLPQRVLEPILSEYGDSEQQLLFHVIREVLRQRPRTTWRDIINALRSPAVGGNTLAAKLERDLSSEKYSTLKDSSWESFEYSTRSGMETQFVDVTRSKRELSMMEETVQRKQKELEAKTRELNFHQQQFRQKFQDLTREEESIQRQQQEIESKTRELTLHQQQFRQKFKDITREEEKIQRDLLSSEKDREMSLLQQQLREKEQSLTQHTQDMKGLEQQLMIKEVELRGAKRLIKQVQQQTGSDLQLSPFVLCYHQERGCNWQGNLAGFTHHIQICRFSAAGLIKIQATEEEYKFVETPSEDYNCPITTSLLLKPHLTSCCGKHLSEESANKIKGKNGACPMCNEHEWSTFLDKRFQRQVKSLKVFCRNDDRGCGWQGELGEMNHHLESCVFVNTPPISQLWLMSSENKIKILNASITTKISFCYNGEQMEFIWKDAGIILYFPSADCQGEKIIVSVEVLGNIDGESLLPKGYHLIPAVSATYRITSTTKLPAPVKMRIEHCAVVEKEDDIVFMAAHDGPPYSFKVLPNAIFPIAKSYGEIEVKTFSIFCLFRNLKCRWFGPMRLAIQLFYHDDHTATFVVTKNNPAHVIAVREEVKCSKYETISMLCHSSTDEIVLDLPKESDGWKITSNPHPARLRTFDIKSYEPREVFPNLTLRAKWTDSGSSEPEEKTVSIGLQAREGTVESFDLLCRPPQQSKQSTKQEAQVDGINTPQYITVKDRYEQLQSALDSNTAASNKLRAKYVMNDWLVPTASPKADDLINLALSKINKDVNNYELFRGMLQDIAGLKDILVMIFLE